MSLPLHKIFQLSTLEMNNTYKTMILAIGNAGGNMLDSIRRETNQTRLKDARYIFVDCNEDDLNNHLTDNSELILLDSGRDEFPNGVFGGIEKLVIVAGLGGKTGTKYAELAAKSAIDAGIASVNVIATLPFVFEGDSHVQLATSAARKLSDINGVNVTVFKNEELLAKYPDLNFLNAFEAADNEIVNLVQRVIE